jgi:hypothetical protein
MSDSCDLYFKILLVLFPESLCHGHLSAADQGIELLVDEQHGPHDNASPVIAIWPSVDRLSCREILRFSVNFAKLEFAIAAMCFFS